MIIVNILGEFEKGRHGKHAHSNQDITRVHFRLNNVYTVKFEQNRGCRKIKEPRKR